MKAFPNKEKQTKRKTAVRCSNILSCDVKQP